MALLGEIADFDMHSLDVVVPKRLGVNIAGTASLLLNGTKIPFS